MKENTYTSSVNTTNNLSVSPAESTPATSPVRESGFELLRILSMIMIVAFHTFRYIDTSDFTPWQMLLYHGVRWYGLFGVNCFLIISAWFMIGKPIKTRKLFDLIVQTAFYCVLLFLGHIIYETVNGTFHPVEDILEVELTALLSPFWANRYWFITAYVFLYLMIPFLNRWILSLSRESYRKWIAVTGIFVFCYLTLPQNFSNTTAIGDFLWVCYVYFLTGYLKLHSKENIFTKHAGKLLIMTYALFVVSKQLLTYCIHNDYLEQLVSHTTGNSMRYSFWMLLLAIELFYLFRRVHFKSRIINTIASCMFGVYLFHENKVFHICELLAKNLLKPFTGLIPCLPFFMLALVLIQLLAGILLDLLRQHTIETYIHTHLSTKWESLFQKWDKKLN